MKFAKPQAGRTAAILIFLLSSFFGSALGSYGVARAEDFKGISESTFPASPEAPEIQVSSSRVSEGRRANQKISFDATDSEVVAPQSLAAALIHQANVQVVPTPMQKTNLSLNGFSGEHVAVLQDGDSILGRTAGAFDARSLSLGSSEQISIYEGLDSLPYGSQNIGGAVVLESPWQAPRRSTMHIGAGSLGRTFFGAGLGTRTSSRTQAWLSASNWRSEAILHPERPRDTLASAVARAAADGGAAQKELFHFGSRWFDLRQTGYFSQQNSKGLLSGERTEQNQRRYGAALDARSKKSGIRFSWNRFWSKSQGLSSQGAVHSNDQDIEEVLKVAPYVEETFGVTTVLGGVSYEADELRSTRLISANGNLDWSMDVPIHEQRVGPYLGFRHSLSDAFTAGVGARYDSFPKLWSPRGEFTWRVGSNLGLHETTWSSGLGFREASAREKYLNYENEAVGYRVVGNPTLQTERVWTSQVRHVLDWKSGNLNASASFSRLQNSIQFAGTGQYGIWTYANLGRAETISALVTWEEQLRFVGRLFGSGTSTPWKSRLQTQWTYGRNLDQGGNLFLQPAERVVASLGRFVDRGWTFSGSATWTASQVFFDYNRNGIADDEWVPSFWMTSAEVSYGFRWSSIADLVHIYARVENIGDVVRPQTFPIEPRTLFAGLKAEL